MDRRCSRCGGELVEGVLLDNATFHSVIFAPAGTSPSVA